LERVDRYLKDFCIRGLLHQREVAGSHSFVAGYLEKDTELRVEVRERSGPDLGANAFQIEELFFAGEFLDLIAQDQDMDAGENRTVRHGGAPPETGGTGKKRSIPPASSMRNTD
jgi:hypothetical protein